MATVILWLFVLGYVVLCVLLLFFILMQSGKGGGLSGLAQSNPLSESLGAAGSQKTLSKWTAYCAAAFFIMTLVITLLGVKIQKKSSSLLGNLPANAPKAVQTAEKTPVASQTVAVTPAQNQQSSEQKPAEITAAAPAASPQQDSEPAAKNEQNAPQQESKDTAKNEQPKEESSADFKVEPKKEEKQTSPENK